MRKADPPDTTGFPSSKACCEEHCPRTTSHNTSEELTENKIFTRASVLDVGHEALLQARSLQQLPPMRCLRLSLARQLWRWAHVDTTLQIMYGAQHHTPIQQWVLELHGRVAPAPTFEQ